MSATPLSRRDVLKTMTAGVIVRFTIDSRPLAGTGQAATAPPAGQRPLDPKLVDSFLAFHTDGTVTIYTSKVDVGTGMRVAIAQMAAEELGVPLDRITVIDGDTSRCPNTGGTGGSTGLTRGGTAVRQAAATARQALLARAADRLGAAAAGLTLDGGRIRPLAGGAGIAIAALTDGKPLALAVDPGAPLTAPSRYAVVGTSPARPDVPLKCTGRYTYVQDLRVPGMVHARVIRPPGPGARLLSVDDSTLRGLPGVRVVRLESFLAVVSPDEWAAVRAASDLRATWSEGAALPDHAQLDGWARHAAVARDQVIVNRGSAESPADAAAAEADGRALEAALDAAPRRFSATYFWPNQSHASLGPSAAVADVRDDGETTVWTSSQVTYGLRNTLARLFGLEAERMRVIFVEGSGSYGTNGADHAAADAVLLSKTLRQPVRVQWSRQDEHAWDPKGPQQLIELRAGVDAHGRIEAWDTQMWIPENRRGPRVLLAADAAGIPHESGRDAAAIFENGDPPYEADRVRVLAHWLRDTPLNPSNLRAPGKPGNVFAVEGFVDEICAALKIDPLAFRIARLSDPRALEVLRRAAAAFGWHERPSPNPSARRGGLLAGRGMAYIRYKGTENYVAMFVEATVEPATGQIAVRRVVCAHDCGLVVNPDALRNQIEGAIVQALSRALHEEVQFDTSHVTSVDWASYPILTCREAPEIEVILVERREEALWGAGEAATVPVPAALGNAVFDATGVRIRRVPLTAARVKAALAQG